MKYISYFLIICFLILQVQVSFANDVKKYVVKSDELIHKFAKQNLENPEYLPELLKFNDLNFKDINSKTCFKDLGLKDGSILLIPPLSVLKNIRNAKSDAEKNEIILKYKKFNYKDFYVKIKELKNKLKEGNISTKDENIKK